MAGIASLRVQEAQGKPAISALFRLTIPRRKDSKIAGLRDDHVRSIPLRVAVGTRVTSRPLLRSVRAPFCIRLVWGFLCQGASRHFRRPLHSILLFDPRREHSSVPTAYFHRRRAQRRSRTALLQRRRRLVLDGREHGGRLPAIGWLAAR